MTPISTDPPAETRPPRRRRAVFAVIVSVSVFALTQGLTYPLLALILDSMGQSRVMIGASTAMTLLAMLLTAGLVPRLAGRFGAWNLAVTGILGAVSELGTFTDDKGHSGTYSLVLAPKIAVNTPAQLLDIEFKTIAGSFQGGSRRYVVTFTPASKRLNAGLNGKTVTFSKSAAGSSAKASPISGFLGDIYLKY